jgi:hypothetical protein
VSSECLLTMTDPNVEKTTTCIRWKQLNQHKLI